LINADNNRAESADARLARNTRDARSVVVRTQIGCIICHTPDGGLIAPTNKQFAETFGHGGNVRKLKDVELKRIVDAFFIGWEEEYKGVQDAHVRAVARITADGNKPGWKPQQLVAALIRFSDWYDDPVTSAQAAAEMGINEAAFRALCLQSPKTRINNLAVGKPIPRSVWETDTQKEFGLLFDASGADLDPIRRLIKPELFQDALKRVEK
jgi:hypothetical protein